MLFENKNDDEVIKSAIRGIEKISKNLIVRADVAEIMIKSAKRSNNNEIMFKGIQAAFESNVDINNFLRLFEIPNNDEIIKQAMERAKEVVKESTGIYSYSESQNRETSITKYKYDLLKLFNYDFEYIYEMCKKDKKAVGWSSSLKGIVVPIFMILLKDKNTNSKLIDKEILMFIDNIYYKYKEDERLKFIYSFKQWVKRAQLTNEEHNKYLQWCSKEVDERVKNIVSNQYRGAYYKAAILIVSLAKIYDSIEENSGIVIIKRYRAMFPRHRAFLTEMDRV